MAGAPAQQQQQQHQQQRQQGQVATQKTHAPIKPRLSPQEQQRQSLPQALALSLLRRQRPLLQQQRLRYQLCVHGSRMRKMTTAMTMSHQVSIALTK
jgi:hypothetical protein